VDDGVPEGLDPRADRADRHRVLGNAVSPAVSYALGRAILEAA
jgi:site-specific DNA-cytosine methylase